MKNILICMCSLNILIESIKYNINFLHNSILFRTFAVKYFTLKQLTMTQNKFVIRTYGKSEFALLMFPTIDDPKVAQAKLLRRIKKDPRFHKHLLEMGLSPFDNDYSPEQVRMMVEKFGAPGEYEV